MERKKRHTLKEEKTCTEFTARLATLLRRVATCCNMLGVVGSNSKMVKFSCNIRMLHDVVVVWPGSSNSVVPGHAC